MLPCPEGNFCPTRSSSPLPCDVLAHCPTGSSRQVHFFPFLCGVVLLFLYWLVGFLANRRRARLGRQATTGACTSLTRVHLSFDELIILSRTVADGKMTEVSGASASVGLEITLANVSLRTKGVQR